MDFIDKIKDYNIIKQNAENYNTPDGIYLKPREMNDLSHIYGGYYLSKKYPKEKVLKFIEDKEGYDSFWYKPLKVFASEKYRNKKADTVRDLINGKFGLDLYSKNPNMTDKEVMDWVYNNYLKQMRNIYDEQQRAEKNVSAIIQDDDFGQYGQGNIDLYSRPQVKNPDGSISTVRSMSFNDGENEVLIPTVMDNGTIATPQEAIDNYYKTGKYLGKFNTVDDANNYAQRLHQQQQRYYLK